MVLSSLRRTSANETKTGDRQRQNGLFFPSQKTMREGIGKGGILTSLQIRTKITECLPETLTSVYTLNYAKLSFTIEPSNTICLCFCCLVVCSLACSETLTHFCPQLTIGFNLPLISLLLFFPSFFLIYLFFLEKGRGMVKKSFISRCKEVGGGC